MDTFLEREQELMKMNDTLNSRISFDWKAPNQAINPATAVTAAAITKPKTKPPPNKSIKSEAIPSKSTSTSVRHTLKSKNDNYDSDKIAANSNNTHANDANVTKQHKQRDLDWKDNAYGAINRNGVTLAANKPDQTHDQSNGVKLTMTEFTAAITDKIISSDRIETNASALSLIPQTMMKRNVSTDGIIKFLKAKVTILQQELELSHQENAKLLDKIAKAAEQQKKLDGARCQASNTINSLNSQIKKHQQKETNTALKLKENEAIQQAQRKECDELKAKLKSMQQLNASLEIRLNKCQEDLECVRKNYQTVKTMQKDLQTTLQHDRTFYENQLKITQKQRIGLLTALKKQMLLMENLKRQNVCLAQAKCVQMAENEFLKILDWTNTSKK